MHISTYIYIIALVPEKKIQSSIPKNTILDVCVCPNWPLAVQKQPFDCKWIVICHVPNSWEHLLMVACTKIV